MSRGVEAAGARPAVVLHVGMGKTGTSSIQAWFHRNRQRLLGHGVLFPESPGKRRHARLSLAVQADDFRRPRVRRGVQEPPASQLRPVVREQLESEIRAAGPSRLLLSDEGLCGAPGEAIDRLRQLLDGLAGPVRVVYYLRRQDEHLCSRYQQAVKWNRLTARLAERADRMEQATLYDYRARLEAWHRVLRPDELVVRRFEREDFVGGNLQRDFLSAAGLPLRFEDFQEGPTRNTSLDAESVELLRLLNLLDEEQGGEAAGMPPWKQTLRTLRRAPAGQTLALPKERMERFMSRWEESNRAVARKYFPDGPETLFETARKTRDTTTEQYLDPTRLDHFLKLLGLPPEIHAPLRRIAEREARAR